MQANLRAVHVSRTCGRKVHVLCETAQVTRGTHSAKAPRWVWNCNLSDTNNLRGSVVRWPSHRGSMHFLRGICKKMSSEEL